MDDPILSLRDQGIEALRAGNLDGAVDLLARSVMADSHDAEAQAFLGVAYSQKGLHQQAKRALETAVELQPDESSYRFNLGVAMELLGDPQGAAMVFHETLQLDPNHEPAQAKLRGLQTPASDPAAPATPAAPWQQVQQPQLSPSPPAGYAPASQPAAYAAINEVPRPFGLSFIVILNAIGSVFGTIAGVMLMIGVSMAVAGPSGQRAPAGAVVGMLMTGVGVFLIIWCLGNLVVGRFLWKGFNWARIVFIVMVSIGILVNLAQFSRPSPPSTGYLQLVMGICYLFVLNSQATRDYCHR